MDINTERRDERERGLCWCGCGTRTAISIGTDSARGDVAGNPRRYVIGHVVRKAKTKEGYHHRTIGGRGARVHVHRAEKALGRPLPKGVEVHHADGSKDDDAPLVICQDRAYHVLLHVRMRIVRAGGDPDAEKLCGGCQTVKPLAEFGKNKNQSSGLSAWCRLCHSRTAKARWANRIAEKKIMNINADRTCTMCGADWRGGPICPVCDFEPQDDDNYDGPAETDDWSGGFAENH